jgi:anti-anti-sigma factor
MHVIRPRWVTAELDVNGQIDGHAAMCLGFAIEAACAGGDAVLLVDLRELTTIDDCGLEQFVRRDAECRSSGVQLAILICADARQEAIVHAFTAAGLGDRLQVTYRPGPPPRPPSRTRVRSLAIARRPWRATTAPQ